MIHHIQTSFYINHKGIYLISVSIGRFILIKKNFESIIYYNET